MKKLAIIGCGIAAFPILEKANELNIKTYCFALSCDNKCLKYNFEFIKCDIFDIEKIISICKKEKIDGVIASSEITTEITAIVAEQLGLIGNKRINGEFTFKNKYLMRGALKNSSIVKQPYYSYYNEGDIIKYPVVVKALDSCGKKGVSFAENELELKEAVKYAFNATKKTNIIIEQYINGGIEYSVEAISYKGKNHIIQITQKDSSGPPHFAELGHHQPAFISLAEKNKITNAVDEILTKIGITNGLSHTEIKIKDGDIYFIESGARAGGDQIGDVLVKLSTNFDYYKGAIDVALGRFKFNKFIQTKYSGIYFLCNQTKYLEPLFEIASKSSWCYQIKKARNLIEKTANDDNGNSGYLIYASDHKITLKDYPFKATLINKNKNTLNMLMEFSKKTNRIIEKTKLINGMKKFLEKGNVIAILYKNQILAMANIYCNDFESKEAYLNNVEVLKEYRGIGLSNLLVEKAISIAKANNFNYIKLNVEEDNTVAVNLYKKYNFLFSNNYTIIENRKTREMILKLGE